MGTIEGWLDRAPETPEDRAIREEGERLKKAFPRTDFDPRRTEDPARAELTKQECQRLHEARCAEVTRKG
jgi:hypothetical protein